MHVEVHLDYQPFATLDAEHQKVVIPNSQIVITYNPGAGGQVLAFDEKSSFVSTDGFPKNTINQPVNYGDRPHFLTLIPIT